MPKQKNLFPQATRPIEYVAVFKLCVPTAEGPAHLFLACDAYSEYGFQLCVRPDDSPNSLFVAVFELLEHKDFKKYSGTGFTLVFDQFEELNDSLTKLVEPKGGKVIFNAVFNELIARPMRTSVMEFLSKQH